MSIARDDVGGHRQRRGLAVNLDLADDVHLTGASRQLAAMEQSLRELPAVDEVRVAVVRQRLSGGEYKVDPQRIADRLLGLERDLGRAAPFDDLA